LILGASLKVGRWNLDIPNGIATAQSCLMWDVVLSVLALVAGAITLELFTAAKAPYGYQDERGFHFGIEPTKSTSQPQQEKP
jgi:hypothetical protein